MSESTKKMKSTTSQDVYRLPLRSHAKDALKCLLLPLKKLTTSSTLDNLKRFVIFGRGRTGSTLLTTLLDSHPGINCQDELLSRYRLFPLTHVEWCATRSQADVQAFGFHLKPWQITQVQYREPHRFMRRLVRRGYRIVHLVRENVFLQSLSEAKLFMYDIVHKTNRSAKPKDSVHVDTELLLKIMKNKKGPTGPLAEECLRVLNEPIITIKYESDLLNDAVHQETCARICRFIGIKSALVSTPHKKVSPSNWRSGVTNSAEVAFAVTKEGFGEFIEMADNIGDNRAG